MHGQTIAGVAELVGLSHPFLVVMRHCSRLQPMRHCGNIHPPFRRLPFYLAVRVVRAGFVKFFFSATEPHHLIPMALKSEKYVLVEWRRKLRYKHPSILLAHEFPQRGPSASWHGLESNAKLLSLSSRRVLRLIMWCGSSPSPWQS